MIVIEFNTVDVNKPTVLYDNVFLNGTLTASSGVGENAISGTTWDFWSGVGSSTLDVDLGVTTEVNCLFIDAHNLSTVSSDVVLSKWDGGAWVVIATVTPPTNEAIMVLFPFVSATKYRVTATGADIGVVMLGNRLVFPQGTDQGHRSIDHSRIIDLVGGDSLAGQFTGNKIVKRSASVDMTFPLLDAGWVDSDMSEFEAHYNEGKPFAFASFPSKFPNDMGYCQRPIGSGELRPSYYEGGLYQEMNMALAVYQNV